MDNKLYRSDDAVIGGVCAGLAEHFDIDPILVRILTVVLALSSFGLVAFVHVLLWLILPKRPCAQGPIDASAGAAYGQAGCPPCAPCSGDQGGKPGSGSLTAPKCAVWVGVSLLIVGFAGILGVALDGVHWWQLWPLAFMLGGVALMVLPGRRSRQGTRICIGLMLFCAGLVMLCCSVGLLSWQSVGAMLEATWPLFMVVAGLIIIGSALDNGMFIIVGGCVFVVMCLLGLTAYAIPGPLDAVLVQLPFGEPFAADINPWV